MTDHIDDHVDAHVHERRWLTLIVLCLSLVIIVMDNTILNVALPTLVRDLGASTSQLQWIVDGYTLVFAGLLLTAGSLGDRFGRRGALRIGLVIFAAGSFASSAAGTANQLIFTRALMGIGGALIMPSTLSILTNVFRDPKERGRAIAIWAGCSGLAVALGPVTGGFLLQHFYWGSVFLVNLPIVALTLGGSVLWVPTSKDPAAPRIDVVGAGLSIAALVSLLWAIIQAPDSGWTDGNILAAFALAAALIPVFVAWELHSDHPMLDVNFFRNRRFSAANGAITLTFFAMFGSLFLLTQYLQFVHGYSALAAGLRILPYAGTMMVFAPLSARLVEGIGTKRVVAVGMVLVSAGLTMMSLVGVDTPYPILLIPMLTMAVGLALTMAPATESVMGSLPRAKAGVGSAVNDTTRQVGGALGVAIIGSLVSSAYSSSITSAIASSGQQIPAEASHAVTSSIGAALEVASRVGGTSGQSIASAARHAFTDAMGKGYLVGAAVAIVGAAMVVAFLPARAVEVAQETAAEPATASGADEGREILEAGAW